MNPKKFLKIILVHHLEKYRYLVFTIFTHKITGAKYVVSSSQLAIRLSGYLNYTHKPIGKFVPLLLKDKLSNFTLEVIPLVDNYKFRSEIGLE